MLDVILSNMSEGVLAIDKNGKVILANPAIEKMFGVIEPEILGRTVRESIRNNEITGLFEQALKERKIFKGEINIVVPIEAIFLAQVSPIFDNEKQLFGAVGVLHDISDLRKLERHRSEFIANISHELKTPLTAIKSYIETLANGAIDDKKNSRGFLDKINKHADNLTALIEDILELSRLESKKELSPLVKINLPDLINHAIEAIFEKAKKKNISINTQCKDEKNEILGMEDHIYRAIVNLLDNAVNYTNNGGKIEVSCKHEYNQIEISISDNGIGIPKVHLSRIFERFYRIDKARSRDIGGTGLGLAIVKHVMNAHNGSVSVESEEEKGSKFTLIFPL